MVVELGAVGRNLNQIARATHQATPAPESRRGDVLTMLKVCVALRDHVKVLLTENAVSWKVGYAKPNP